ncbi:MAG: Lrp/AsnC ligand binding domain-containing protein [Candidatus Bathyarchaeota archaeon]|nr:Lrp/AsnC ligand binding domain-containing protein [Candidatus Bathyarchaeota archaeon]
MKNMVVVINVFAESKELDKVAAAIAALPESIDVYEVTGEYDIVVLVGADDIASFRDFLKNKILKINGVNSTVTSLILHTHKENGKIVYK